MTKQFIISEEMLDSLASEYMTPDAAMIIVNNVKTQNTPKPEGASLIELKFAQARALKELYQWTMYANTPDQELFPGEYSGHREAWESTQEKIRRLQQRLFPEVPIRLIQQFNDMTRDPDYKDASEKEWFDEFKEDREAHHKRE
jgi:hypothetical protein